MGAIVDRSKRRNFAKALKELYEAAGGREVGLRKLVSLGRRHGIEVSEKRLSAWMIFDGARGPEAPGPTLTEYIVLLTADLELHAQRRDPGHRGRSPEGWRQLLRDAQDEGSTQRGGRPRSTAVVDHSPAPEPEFVLPGHQCLAEGIRLPDGLRDREAELAELAAFATDRSPQARTYTWWQAGPWTGKSALLAWFVLRKRPVDVDVVGYFIADWQGENDRASFLDSVIRQLAVVAGQKIRARGQSLERFYELLSAAAEAAGSRGRTLLLVVDGLDEDEGARPGGRTIAALLPANPPSNLRVVVTGRPNPAVPRDVPDPHPLRDPSIVRQLSEVPAAKAARVTATRELDRLIEDKIVGIEIVGFLAAARGGLRTKDLAKLLNMTAPTVTVRDVEKPLRSITGRSLAYDHTLLSSDRAYVLGHKELLVAALEELGDIAPYEERLCVWADDWHAKGWPEETPPYLLHHCGGLLQRTGDTARLTAYALDARRQQRLVATAAADIALQDLDRAAEAVTGDSPADLEILAAVAASRDLISAAACPLPRAVSRALARLGDVPRAQSLALASPGPAGRAYALADTARTLSASGDWKARDEARRLAREAETWARTALREADSQHGGIDVAESGAAAACALIESGQPETAMDLLQAAACDAWDYLDAAAACLPHDPQLAEKLWDEAEQRAEHVHPWHAPPEDPESAVHVWTEIIRAAPDRVERVCDLIHAHGAAQDASPGQRAAASTALITYRPEAAAELAEQARAELAAMLQAPGGAGYDPMLATTLDLVVQALTDTGRPAEAEKLRADVPQEALTDPIEFDFKFAGIDEDRDQDDAPSAAHLAQEALELAECGRSEEARKRLEAALRRHAAAARRTGGVRWLVLLAGALAADGTSNAENAADQLIGLLSDSADRARAYASAAMASAETGAFAPALRLARQAAQEAETLRDSAVAERILAAQALAHAGDTQAAQDLFTRTGSPNSSRVQSPHQRKELFRGWFAVMKGLRNHEPAAVARRIDQRREKITQDWAHDTARLLQALAELLPLVPDSDPGCRGRILEAVYAAGLSPSAPPGQWQPENRLIWALLHPAGATEEQTRILVRLTRSSLSEWENDPYERAQASAALVRAAMGDLDHAQRVAETIDAPSLRASTYAALAGHITRVPAPLPTTYETLVPHPHLPLLRALALMRLPGDAALDEEAPVMRAAQSFARRALTTGEDWHQALPVLARLAPAAVQRIHALASAHLGL
ncbi:hypothetical protein [Streptomyces sp. NPDC058955]|uniref:hypothetical protein n=1 Tax=unclassified Streptomyces TaxID=2593676 RepID=UPI00364BBB50